MSGMNSIENVGSGWRPVVAAAVHTIENLGGHITQIKEKFGGLRIYYYSEKNHDSINLIIQAAERSCSFLCEECGETGHSAEVKGWMKCLCDKHEKELNERK